jgi:mannose-6-phosphate isomerase
MRQTPLYPLRFEPIYQYRVWGGRRLTNWLSAPLPGDGPIGEAWVLSDRDDHPSRVADGPLKGLTISQLMERSRQDMLGKLAERFSRFPLLLKFLDAHQKLSVQVHPAGAAGKTEGWVVLEAGTAAHIYPGLKPGTTADDLRRAITNGTVADQLLCFAPNAGDSVFLPGGMVHTLGDGVVVFEVQQNSDVTFRLDDWNRVDPKTGQRRDLQVDQAFACIDFGKSSGGLVEPVIESAPPLGRTRLFDCEYFRLWRLCGAAPFTVGAAGESRVLVFIEGTGQIEHAEATYEAAKGDVFLLPAVLEACTFRPRGAVHVLEIAIPE